MKWKFKVKKKKNPEFPEKKTINKFFHFKTMSYKACTFQQESIVIWQNRVEQNE